MRRRGDDRPLDQRLAGENARRIMDQDNARTVGLERFEPGANAVLPRRAAEDRRLQARRAADASSAATLAR